MKNPKRRVQGELIMVGPLFYPILQRNGGIFPDNDDEMIVNAFCAWYIAKCAHKAILDIPAQVTMEGDTDVTVNLRNIVRGCMQAYGLDADSGDAIGKVMALMPLCRQWAFRRNLNWSDRWQAWLDSGGYSYNIVTREPDAI